MQELNPYWPVAVAFNGSAPKDSDRDLPELPERSRDRVIATFCAGSPKLSHQKSIAHLVERQSHILTICRLLMSGARSLRGKTATNFWELVLPTILPKTCTTGIFKILIRLT